MHASLLQTCASSACTQVFTDVTKVISAAAPLKSPIPSITQICGSIPSITMVAPVVAGVPSSTAAPATAAAPAK